MAVAAQDQRQPSTERITVEAGAMLVAMTRVAHQQVAADTRKLAVAMLAELRATTMEPELFARVSDLLGSMDDEPTADQRQQMRDMVGLVASLPQRTKVLRDLVDALHKCVGIEREAVGLDTASGTDGRPMVIIKDYTGRGDVDSPVRDDAAA